MAGRSWGGGHGDPTALARPSVPGRARTATRHVPPSPLSAPPTAPPVEDKLTCLSPSLIAPSHLIHAPAASIIVPSSSSTRHQCPCFHLYPAGFSARANQQDPCACGLVAQWICPNYCGAPFLAYMSSSATCLVKA